MSRLLLYPRLLAASRHRTVGGGGNHARNTRLLLIAGLCLLTGHTHRPTAFVGAGVLAPSDRSDTTINAQLVDALRRLPLSFEINRGQAQPEVQFVARGLGYSIFLESTQ